MKNKKFGKKVIWLQLSLIFLQMFVGFISFDTLTRVEAKEISNSNELKFEKLNLRESDSKTYELADGSLQKESYSNQIHYKVGKNWLDINNNIIKIKNNEYTYKNGANDFEVYLGKNAKKGIKVRYKGAEYKMSLPGENNSLKEVSINGSKAVYPDVFKGVDWEITFINEGYVSELVIKNNTAIQDDYAFTVETDLGTDIKILKNGSIGVYKNNKFIWQTDQAVMHDAVFDYEKVNITYQNQKEIVSVQNTNKNKSDNKAYVSNAISDNQSENILNLQVNTNWLKNTNRKFPIKIDPSLSISATKDTFVSPSTKNPNNGGRRMMLIGKYTDYTLAGYPTFYKSRALIDFGNINLPATAIVTSTNLELYHYATNSGNQALYVTLPTTPWDEHTVWPGPNVSGGDYGHMQFPYYNSNFTAVKRSIGLNQTILKDMHNGLMVKNYNENARGVAVCSSNIPSGPCKSGMQPKLVVNYYLNQKPNPPKLNFPNDGSKFGATTSETNIHCDGTGVGLGCDVNFQINVKDPDNSLPLSTNIKLISDNGGNKIINLIGNGDLFKQIHLTDGNWTWHAKTTDKFGLAGDWSVKKHFLIDTTAPNIPVFMEESLYTAGNENELIVDINDNTGLKYEFELSDLESFDNVLDDSDWIVSKSHIFQSLVNDTKYYYRVRVKDELGNISDWSELVSSTQDNIMPNISNIILADLVISPKNLDGVLDTTEISFEIIEQNLDKVSLEMYNQNNQLVLLQNNLTNYTVTLFGKDNNGEYLDDGVYKIFIKAIDYAGNETTSSETLLYIDNKTPVFNISSPKDGVWFKNNKAMISGIEEINANSTLLHLKLGNKYKIVSDPNTGIFSTEIDLIDGMNDIEATSFDSAQNLSNITLNLFKEITSPVMELDSPKGITNDAKLKIVLNAEDFGYLKDGKEYISGLDWSTFNLSLINSNDEEILLVSNGENISTLGVLSKSCQNFEIVGLNKPAKCEVTYMFDNSFSTDGVFKIRSSIDDVAGNKSNKQENYFELDTHTFLEIKNHINGELLNYSNIQIDGRGEFGASLKIESNIDSKLVTIDPSIAQDGVTISNCVDSPSPKDDGIRQICDWQVASFQLDRSTIEGDIVLNNIKYTLIDEVGNKYEIDHQYQVDLYAVNLQIDTDIKYFSPNGDGRQDGIEFINITTDGKVKNWSINIYDSKNILIRQLNGSDNLPGNLFWDGKYDSNNPAISGEEWILDGDYKYNLSIVTIDNISVETLMSELYARTNLLDEVVITSPKTGAITTNGVINLQGQGPKDSIIKICVDTIGLDSKCDFEYQTNVDDNSSFISIIPLIRLVNTSETHHIITAVAQDIYGNTTKNSNNVEVIVDTNTPFVSFSAIPTLTGVNTQEEYQIILNKLENGENITQSDIDNLRNIVLRSVVTKNTEYVSLEYRDLTNLKELPKILETGYLGYIDKSNQTYLYTDINDNTQVCDNSTCTLDFYYPVPPITGGLYEIFATAKKGELSEKISASVMIDGTLPTAPSIIGINKRVGEDTARLPRYFNKYYSNSKDVEIIGVSDANLSIKIFDNNDNILCKTTSNEVGLFTCKTDLANFYPDYDIKNSNIIELNVEASDGLNNTNSITSETLLLDVISPNIVSVETPNRWVNSGTNIDIDIEGNEKLSLGYIKTPGGIRYKLLVDNLYINTLGYFQIPGNVKMGRYFIEVTIMDLAGNKTTKLEAFYIDDYIPEASDIQKKSIDTRILWGQKNGINIFKGIPASGRLVPNYVYKDKNLNIHGYAEKDSQVNIYFDNTLIGTTLVNNDICNQIKDDVLSDDGIVIKSGEICMWQKEVDLQSEKGHVLYTQVVDKAGNISKLSKDEVIYLDQTNPNQPIISSIVANTQLKYLDLKSGDSSLGITNDQNLTLNISAESLSDLQIEIDTPNSNKNNTKLNQVLGNGNFAFNMLLGTKKDVGSCIQMKNNKRIGICEDGDYKISITSIDAAGNISTTKNHTIKRDTVAPAKVLASEPHICGNNICIDVSGEEGAKLVVNNKMIGNISSSVRTYTVLNHWKSFTKYTFEVKQTDNVDNISESVIKEIMTPDTIAYQGDIKGIKYQENPFDNKYGNQLDDITFKVTIKADESYTISDIKIPAPQLTSTHTMYDKRVEIYGVGIPKYHIITAEINKIYMSYYEAANTCNVGVFINRDDRYCMQKKMGITSLSKWLQQNQLKCIGVLPCLEYKKLNLRINKVFTQTTQVQHSMITFHKSNDNYKYISSLWNDKTYGRFKRIYTLDKEVLSGDWIKAQSNIFGKFQVDGLDIIYNKLSSNSLNETGLASQPSNALMIEDVQVIKIGDEEVKLLDVPFINQYLEPNDSKSYPTDGWQMCGAAASVITAAYFDKLKFNSDHDVKKYMYSDSGQGIKDSCGYNKGGAFAMTNYNCNQSYKGGIESYLHYQGLKTKDLGWRLNDITKIKHAIDKGHPVIFNIQGEGFGHILTIVGYTISGDLVVNDSYTNLEQYGRGWQKYDTGYHSIYPLTSNMYKRGYFIEVY